MLIVWVEFLTSMKYLWLIVVYVLLSAISQNFLIFFGSPNFRANKHDFNLFSSFIDKFLREVRMWIVLCMVKNVTMLKKIVADKWTILFCMTNENAK